MTLNKHFCIFVFVFCMSPLDLYKQNYDMNMYMNLIHNKMFGICGFYHFSHIFYHQYYLL